MGEKRGIGRENMGGTARSFVTSAYSVSLVSALLIMGGLVMATLDESDAPSASFAPDDEHLGLGFLSIANTGDEGVGTAADADIGVSSAFLSFPSFVLVVAGEEAEAEEALDTVGPEATTKGDGEEMRAGYWYPYG